MKYIPDTIVATDVDPVTVQIAGASDTHAGINKRINMTVWPLSGNIWYEVVLNGDRIRETESLQKAIEEYNKH